jgi:hypothetical protein
MKGLEDDYLPVSTSDSYEARAPKRHSLAINAFKAFAVAACLYFTTDTYFALTVRSPFCP